MKIWLFFWLHPQTTDQSLEIETISKAKPYEIRCQIRNLSYPIKWWFARVFSTFGFFKDFQVFFAKLMALTATCNQIVFLCVQPTYLLSQFDLIKIQKTAFTENWNRFCKHIWWKQSLASKWKRVLSCTVIQFQHSILQKRYYSSPAKTVKGVYLFLPKFVGPIIWHECHEISLAIFCALAKVIVL